MIQPYLFLTVFAVLRLAPGLFPNVLGYPSSVERDLVISLVVTLVISLVLHFLHGLFVPPRQRPYVEGRRRMKPMPRVPGERGAEPRPISKRMVKPTAMSLRTLTLAVREKQGGKPRIGRDLYLSEAVTLWPVTVLAVPKNSELVGRKLPLTVELRGTKDQLFATWSCDLQMSVGDNYFVPKDGFYVQGAKPDPRDPWWLVLFLGKTPWMEAQVSVLPELPANMVRKLFGSDAELVADPSKVEKALEGRSVDELLGIESEKGKR